MCVRASFRFPVVPDDNSTDPRVIRVPRPRRPEREFSVLPRVGNVPADRRKKGIFAGPKTEKKGHFGPVHPDSHPPRVDSVERVGK